mgnify:CR=1 FL=1|jgi:hypothetical protein
MARGALWQAKAAILLRRDRPLLLHRRSLRERNELA